MAELVVECPRCSAKAITFDVIAGHQIGTRNDWQDIYEAFCVCRHCRRSTTYLLTLSNYAARDVVVNKGLAGIEGITLNKIMDVGPFISSADINAEMPPEQLSKELNAAFAEGARCMAVGCYNAAGTMFRLCIDLATSSMLPLPEDADGPNPRERRDLGLRLPWLFNHHRLPADLHDLATCVKEDGNDGAHRGSLSEPEARDLLEFTYALLDRLFSQPARVLAAKTRRDERRNPPK